MGLEGIVSKRKDSLSLGALDALDQEQEPERTRGETGSRRGLGPLTSTRRGEFATQKDLADSADAHDLA